MRECSSLPWKKPSSNGRSLNFATATIHGRIAVTRSVGQRCWPSAEPITKMEKLNPNFREFIALIEEAKVEYLLVGGYAVGLHGFPRYTGGMDFFVAIHPANAARLVEVFKQFGFESMGVTAEDFLTPDYVIEIGREPQKIQVLTGIDGVRFAECYHRRLSMEIDGMSVSVIGKADLMADKLASGRAKDQIDVRELDRS